MMCHQMCEEGGHMAQARGLFDGFEAQRTPTEDNYRAVLRNGLVVLDTNVLLDLYRMNTRVREDMLTVLKSIAPRIWVPHQVQLEFWSVRQSEDLISHHDEKASTAKNTLRQAISRSRNALNEWVSNVHLGGEALDIADPMYKKLEQAERLFESIVQMLESQAAKDKVPGIRNTNKDPVIQALEQLLRGRIGAPYSSQRYDEEVSRAKERADQRIPPGYKDFEKKDDDKRAAGDYLVWRQLLDEALLRKVDVLFVTRDIKEDWWRNIAIKNARLPRIELVDELRSFGGLQLFMLEPSMLMQKVSSMFGLEKKVDRNSVAALRHLESEEADGQQRHLAGAEARYRLAQVPGGRTADYVETVWLMANLVEENPRLDSCIGRFMESFPSVTLIPEARRRLMNLAALGLAEVQGERILLTDFGHRFLESRDSKLLSRLFMERIEGAYEARRMLRNGADVTELKYLLAEHPELELSTTQSELLLRWMDRLGLLVK
ncbi:PIN-like domain-containing protein [Kitasatospora purpeofusca]|uniref:PIN-like domain-containing protein n=1 Tax=Kitasatospora purpeofusca TaxID=67352 RepID=UPI00365982B2